MTIYSMKWSLSGGSTPSSSLYLMSCSSPHACYIYIHVYRHMWTHITHSDALSSWRTSINQRISALILNWMKKKLHKRHKEWCSRIKKERYTAIAKQYRISQEEERDKKSQRGWRYDERRGEGTGRHSNTNLFHFSRHGPESPPSFPRKIKTSRGNLWQLFPGLGKLLLSLLSSSRLLTLSLSIYVEFSLCERRGSSSDAGSHPLLSSVEPDRVS